MTKVLDARALNRATLDRQWLLRRVRKDAAKAVEHLVGLQTQVPHNHYTALWSRLEGFSAEDFSGRFERREFVRISLQRSTIHTVTARDCLSLRPVLQVPQDRTLRSAYGKALAGVDIARAAARSRELVEAEPLTFAEIGNRLAAEWPEHDPKALGQVSRHVLPMVQVPPRGLWGQGGRPRHTTAEHWLGRALSSDTAPDELVLRYLAAFGPASVKDVQMWSGLTRLREVIDRHRDRLEVFRDENDVELYDLPDAPRPGRDVPAPARFLPEFDNVFIGHQDRSRIIPDKVAHEAIWKGNRAYPVFLLDGFLRGTWNLSVSRSEAVLTITPFEPLPGAGRTELESEGAALLEFQAAGLHHDIRWDL